MGFFFTIEGKGLVTINTTLKQNHICRVMVSVLASNAVDRGSNQRLLNCFFAKHATFIMRKSKEWLARNQDNVPEWSDMSTRGLLFGELALSESN
jgi:hypothetical protein